MCFPGLCMFCKRHEHVIIMIVAKLELKMGNQLIFFFSLSYHLRKPSSGGCCEMLCYEYGKLMEIFGELNWQISVETLYMLFSYLFSSAP